jgi:alpha-L-rhamnosidase
MRLSFITILLTSIALSANATSVGELRCEFLSNPLGIDATKPRLSWQLSAGRQTAYEIIVDGVWDSGKVTSDQSSLVEYGGQALTSRARYSWKVKVWDQDGKASGWSKPAFWAMGLLKSEDWKGQWIGKDEPEQNAVLKDCSWIWYPEGQPDKEAPLGTRYFRRVFDLPGDRTVTRAEWQLTGDNEFACTVNGRHTGNGNNFKSAVTLNVARSLKPGRNVLACSVKNTGEAPNPAGLVGRLKVEFATGEPLVIPTDDAWKTAKKNPGAWTSLEYDDSTWATAKVVGPVGMKPWDDVSVRGDRRLAARMLRKEFTATTKVSRAMVYMSGLGSSELYLNGGKVGDAVLSPALSQYPERDFYVTYDVTADIKPGVNALGVWLGNGRFYAPRASVPTSTSSHGFPKLLLQLELDYADGSHETVVSDRSWKLTCNGPILANNEYDGEEYDARNEMPGWARVGFDDCAWQAAQLVAAPGGRLSSQMMQPIRVTDTLKPISVTENKPGVFIFDMGQNMVGWCRLRVHGPAGTSVALRHAERLKDDGSLYMDNLRSAKVTDIYTLKGQGTEVYEPRFTYHGFRYVEMTGFPGKPSLASIEGRVVNDDVTSAGTFTCSQPMINRIYHNVLWGVRGNYRSISTDCPQRDERQGWLGDRSAESRGETYLFDIAALYSKWTQDMADAQRTNGSISDVCPSYWPLYNDNVTWPSSAVIIPGALLDVYGDSGIIARLYPNMVKWIDHMSGYITDGIITKDNYGDWCVPPEDPKLIHSKDPARKTAPAILATCYFQHCLKLMSRYAQLLGKPEDAQRFTALAEQLKTALNAKYYDKEKGYYDNGSQTSCVLPLAFDVAPSEERGRIFDHLVKKITDETHGHVGTGLIGGQWLNRVLTDGGRPDLVYGFATNTTYPSWGYMAEKGATTIWELWNGDTADPAMNSGNHVMLVGDLAIWFYECLAGIKPDPAQPGFKHIIMKPHPVGDLKFVEATHRSPYGLIRSEWERSGDKFIWKVSVPPNSTATVYVPFVSSKEMSEGRLPGISSKGVKAFHYKDGAAVLDVESGDYRFVGSIANVAVR